MGAWVFAEGIVNKVGADHLGVLVHGVFNASIGIDDTDGMFQGEGVAEVRTQNVLSPSGAKLQGG